MFIAHDNTKGRLEAMLAKAGAEMLVDVLKSRGFVPPTQDRGWYSSSQNAPLHYAPKIAKQDSFVDFEKHTKGEMLIKQRALGDTWCFLPNGDRLIMHSLDHANRENTHPGLPGIFTRQGLRDPLFRAADGEIGQIKSSTCEGGKAGHGNAKLLRMFPPQKDLRKHEKSPMATNP
jgi:methionyl-tRNA formyltransferase